MLVYNPWYRQTLMFSATFPDDIQPAAVGMVGCTARVSPSGEVRQEGEARGVDGPPRQGSYWEDVGICAGILYSTRLDEKF